MQSDAHMKEEYSEQIFTNSMKMEKIHEEKDLEIFISEDLKWSKQGLFAYTTVNRA